MLSSVALSLRLSLIIKDNSEIQKALVFPRVNLVIRRVSLVVEDNSEITSSANNQVTRNLEGITLPLKQKIKIKFKTPRRLNY